MLFLHCRQQFTNEHAQQQQQQQQQDVHSKGYNRRRLFTRILQPILSTVRLHPQLIVSTRADELTRDRWARKEPHDMFAECAAIVCTYYIQYYIVIIIIIIIIHACNMCMVIEYKWWWMHTCSCTTTTTTTGMQQLQTCYIWFQYCNCGQWCSCT